MKGKKQVMRLSSFDHNGANYKIQDCILVRGKGDKPYVARIKEIKPGSRKDEVEVQVAWYYRPEEALGGRKQFHGEKELFRSEHLDWCQPETILGRCRVHTLHGYQTLKKVTDTDYFSRFSYKPTTHEFRPDRVPVYCVCELPYNPDTFMVMCEKCEEWYHPECIGMSRKQVEAQTSFVCSECQQAGKGDKRQRLEPAATGSSNSS